MGTHPIFESDFDCLTDMSGPPGMGPMGPMGAPHGMGHQQGRPMMGNQMGMANPMGGPPMGHPQMNMGHNMGHPQMGHPQQMNPMMNQMSQMNPNQMMNPSQMMSNQNPHMNINPNMNSMMTPISQMSQSANQSSQNNPMNQISGQIGQTSQTSAQQSTQSQQDGKRTRFIAELEFVQCLANPNYICFLAQHEYFKKPEFINYIKYLEYWREPKYARLIRYPTCLRFLELIQDKHFREAISVRRTAKEIEDQILLAWNRRHRIRNERIAQAHQKAEAKAQGGQPSK